MNDPEISIILPCQNEEQALPVCLEQIQKVIKEKGLSAEVIVSDSSADQSPQIAQKFGAVLAKHDKDGYGNAYLEAFAVAKGKYFFMADADGSYDFTEIPRFIKELKHGNDLVLGNRFGGTMEIGAMPFLNRYFGNPLLSFILRLFFKAGVKDSHTGMRAIRKTTLEQLNLQTAGMEFASEMIIKALKNHLKIKEVPINYHKRIGHSKLRPFSDAWKHLRFMLLYSPLFLFLIPGLVLFFLGAVSLIWLYLSSPQFFGVTLYYHPMFLASALVIIGYQLIIFALFAKSYAINHLGEEPREFEKIYRYLTIERASIAGIVVLALGVILYALIFSKWVSSHFNSFNDERNSIVGLTLIIFGCQTIFSSFMLSILSIKEK
jgi:glycosyltransferase involved in cell wall biosynthesis